MEVVLAENLGGLGAVRGVVEARLVSRRSCGGPRRRGCGRPTSSHVSGDPEDTAVGLSEPSNATRQGMVPVFIPWIKAASSDRARPVTVGRGGALVTPWSSSRPDRAPRPQRTAERGQETRSNEMEATAAVNETRGGAVSKRQQFHVAWSWRNLRLLSSALAASPPGRVARCEMRSGEGVPHRGMALVDSAVEGRYEYVADRGGWIPARAGQ